MFVHSKVSYVRMTLCINDFKFILWNFQLNKLERHNVYLLMLYDYDLFFKKKSETLIRKQKVCTSESLRDRDHLSVLKTGFKFLNIT